MRPQALSAILLKNGQKPPLFAGKRIFYQALAQCLKRLIWVETPGFEPTWGISPIKGTKGMRQLAWRSSAATCLASIVTGLSLCCSLKPALSDEFRDAGFLYDRFGLTLAPGHRTEALGPLFYSEENETQHTWAIPPIFSSTRDPGTESLELDFFYPLLTYDRFGEQYRWELGQLFSISGGPSQTEKDRDRFTLFPVYFQQRSSDTNENYTAVFPLYGHLKNRLFRDEMFFVMFPIYGQTRKKDVITDNYLYPLFHLRHGDALSGWQFWPIAGHEHKDPMMQTNGFGDVQTIGGHEKMFAMWPLYFNQREGIGTDNLQWEMGSLPAFNKLRSPKRDTTTVLWPFFTQVDDREKKYREWELPWPFVVIARGEGKRTTRFFPLFSLSTNASLESDSYLWPVYKYTRIHDNPLDRERTRILFFLYSDTSQKNTETGERQRRRDFWPFYTHEQNYDGNTRLQILALLEPYLPNNKSIQRDYSHLWSIWRSENNPRKGTASQTLFWNLYRHESAPESKRTAFFFGLYQHESNPEGSRTRLCYIPLGGRHPAHGAGKEKYPEKAN
jgi:hypothetical protein